MFGFKGIKKEEKDVTDNLVNNNDLIFLTDRCQSDLINCCCLKVKYEYLIVPIFNDALTSYAYGEGEVIVGIINGEKVELRRIGNKGCVVVGKTYLNKEIDLKNIDDDLVINDNDDCIGFVDGVCIDSKEVLKLIKKYRLVAVVQTRICGK